MKDNFIKKQQRNKNENQKKSQQKHEQLGRFQIKNKIWKPDINSPEEIVESRIGWGMCRHNIKILFWINK